MNTYAQDIEAATEGEPIEAIVIGAYGWSGYREGEMRKANPDLPDAVTGELLTWEQARPMLDYTYDTGYGAPECHSITAWTPNRVLFLVEYDGSTTIDSVPRNPAPVPSHFGG